MNMKMKMFRRRIIVGCLCGVVLIGIVVFNGGGNDLIERVVVPLFGGAMVLEDISCYSRPSTLGSINTFSPDDALKIIKDNKRSIFFHETSCFNELNEINLTSRELCAVESAARMNPNMSVYLFVLSHSNLSSSTRQSMLRLSAVYKNIAINRILIDDYIKDSPLEEWWASGALKKSQWPRSHASDVLRYLTLWKFGGIYLDLDVVITSSLENLTNFAGAEDWESVAAGAIGLLKSTSLGRKIADDCIEDLRANFRGDHWGNNGPGVITRTLQKLCATKYARDMTTSRCSGFTVTPASGFYPIHYKKWKLYFDTKEVNSTMNKIKKSFAIHVWNKFSASEPVHVGSNVPYALVANKYCPTIYKNSATLF